MNETKIETPESLKVDGSFDHGMTLVHELGGKPRNYLHEISIPDYSKTGEAAAKKAGYRVRCGWMDRTCPATPVQMWLWCKEYPLTVAD